MEPSANRERNSRICIYTDRSSFQFIIVAIVRGIRFLFIVSEA